MSRQTLEVATERLSMENALDQVQRRIADVLQEARNKEASAKIDRAFAEKLKRDADRLTAEYQRLEVYCESRLVKTFFSGDLDDARIYAAARPAFKFFVELWDKADEIGGRDLLHSEWINV